MKIVKAFIVSDPSVDSHYVVGCTFDGTSYTRIIDYKPTYIV